MKYGFKKVHGDFVLTSTNESHVRYAEEISRLLAESARQRGIGIARRSPKYLAEKIREGKAVIAFHKDGRLAGFTYIETWSHSRYIANSGLIVVPEFRGHKLGKQLKLASFTLSRKNFPEAKIFSITTSPAVMKMNTELGFRPVPYTELTTEDRFWHGCRSCPNYEILTRNQYRLCLCTGLLFDPAEQRKMNASCLPLRERLKQTRLFHLLHSALVRLLERFTLQPGGGISHDPKK